MPANLIELTTVSVSLVKKEKKRKYDKKHVNTHCHLLGHQMNGLHLLNNNETF